MRVHVWVRGGLYIYISSLNIDRDSCVKLWTQWYCLLSKLVSFETTTIRIFKCAFKLGWITHTHSLECKMFPCVGVNGHWKVPPLAYEDKELNRMKGVYMYTFASFFVRQTDIPATQPSPWIISMQHDDMKTRKGKQALWVCLGWAM